MTEDEISHIRRWTERYAVGETFTFVGWQNGHQGPEAGLDFKQLVHAIRDMDPAVSFIELSTGPGTDGVIGPTTSTNARYYRRIE